MAHANFKRKSSLCQINIGCAFVGVVSQIEHNGYPSGISERAIIIVIQTIHAIFGGIWAVTGLARFIHFYRSQGTPIYCGFPYGLESEIQPNRKAKSPLDNLFHPARIQADLPALD